MTEPTRRSLLEEALRLVTHDRNQTHGDPWDNLGQIAELWSTYLGVPITREQVAICNILQKISRTTGGCFNPDDYTDIIGYGSIAGELGAKERTRVSVVVTGGPITQECILCGNPMKEVETPAGRAYQCTGCCVTMRL